jgi:hypothetical protein
MDALDVLIAQALQARWGNATPSPRIWRRIVRHVASLTVPIYDDASTYRSNQRPDPLLVPFPSAGSLLLWRYDLLLMRVA